MFLHWALKALQSWMMVDTWKVSPNFGHEDFLLLAYEFSLILRIIKFLYARSLWEIFSVTKEDIEGEQRLPTWIFYI